MTELKYVILAEAGQIYQSSELTLLRRVGDLIPELFLNLPSIQPDLRLIASMRFATFPVVKLQQSSEVYCHTESDTNLHGNDKPRIQTSYLLPLVEGQASAVQRVPIVGTSRGSEVRAGGVVSSKFLIQIN